MGIKINYEQVNDTIGNLASALSANQGEVDASYASLAGSFSESTGKEADALRKLQKEEQSLIKEMNQTLAEFAKSIQFAADSLKDLDTSGAKSMH